MRRIVLLSALRSACRFALPLYLVGSAMIMSGCKKDSPAPSTAGPPSTESKPSDGLRVAGAVETPVLAGLPVLAMLPKNVTAIAAIDGLTPTFARFGFDEAVKAHPEVMVPVAKQSIRAFGVDLSVPANLSQVGIDAAAPVGMALLRDGELSVALFASVTDSSKLASALTGFGRMLDSTLVTEKRRGHREYSRLTVEANRRESDFAAPPTEDLGEAGRLDIGIGALYPRLGGS